MGKGIDGKKLVKRSEKLAFLEVISTDGESTYERMEGFTDMSFSKNAKEYSRGYVDEDTDRTDITSYAESISYTFDRYADSPATEEIVNITENEMIGTDAVRRIVTVDLTKMTGLGSDSFSAAARVRPYAIVPDSNGS